MARFSGAVGFGANKEDPPESGIWVEDVIESIYQGDVIQNTRQNQQGETVNDDIVLSATIAIVADPFAVQHVSNIKYVRWEGVAWSVTSVQIRSPRLILSLGSVYNGPTPAAPGDPEGDPGVE